MNTINICEHSSVNYVGSQNWISILGLLSFSKANILKTMVGKPVFTSIILVILVASVNSDGCLCTDKFKELFGITDAVAQIQRAYFKNDDIRVPLYGFYFNLIRELGTDFVISIAKYDSLDKHPIWDPFVKNLTGEVP